jgi:hypothetical protein
VGSFGFGDRTFDSHMIDLSVVLSLLPLIVKVGVRASDDGEDCAWVRKLLVCYGGSQIYSRGCGGGLDSSLFC